MKFGKHPQEEAAGLQLAPLIDIVFLTLVFFMTTAVFTSLESDLDIQLPTADSASDIERSRGEIYINLKSDGSIVLNDRELTVPELQDVLYRVAENAPGASIIIRGDRLAALEGAIAILNCCRNADIQDVSFAALAGSGTEAS
jgi:biopolymer transport protein ExbD